MVTQEMLITRTSENTATISYLPGSSILSSSIIINELYLLGALLVMIQILDGCLTFIGIQIFGIQVEGNLLLQNAMHQFGPVATLALTKGTISIICLCLISISKKIPWTKNGLILVSSIYLICAIFPWAYIISSSVIPYR